MSRDIAKILKNQKRRKLLSEQDPKLNIALSFVLQQEVSDYLNKAKEDLENSLKKVKEQINLVEKVKIDLSDKINKIKDGYTPIKGKDYFDGKSADEEKIIKNVLARIEKPKDGKDADEDSIFNKLLVKIPKPKDGIDGKDGSPDTPEQIAEKINNLEERIEIKTIKGLKTYFDNISKKIQEVKSSKNNGKRGGGASNTIHESHSVNSSTTSITLQYNVANNGNKIFVGYSGGVIEKDVHYTVSGKTITLLETLADNTYLYIIYDRS